MHHSRYPPFLTLLECLKIKLVMCCRPQQYPGMGQLEEQDCIKQHASHPPLNLISFAQCTRGEQVGKPAHQSILECGECSALQKMLPCFHSKTAFDNNHLQVLLEKNQTNRHKTPKQTKTPKETKSTNICDIKFCK